MKKRSITASDFDKRFDEGADVTAHLEFEDTTRPGLQQKRVSVDFPEWMVHELDKVSKKLGVTRQSIIKIFITDRLKKEV